MARAVWPGPGRPSFAGPMSAVALHRIFLNQQGQDWVFSGRSLSTACSRRYSGLIVHAASPTWAQQVGVRIDPVMGFANVSGLFRGVRPPLRVPI